MYHFHKIQGSASYWPFFVSVNLKLNMLLTSIKKSCFVLIAILPVFLHMSCKNANSTSSTDIIENIIENYGTGETSRTYTRINGKIDGTMIDYYPSGAKKGERFFINDKQEGKTTLYYENGAIKEVQYYTLGLKDGGDTLFYESGKLKYVSEFKEDKKNGYLRKWNEKENLIYEAKFAMDTLIEVEGQSIK